MLVSGAITANIEAKMVQIVPMKEIPITHFRAVLLCLSRRYPTKKNNNDCDKSMPNLACDIPLNIIKLTITAPSAIK